MNSESEAEEVDSTRNLTDKLGKIVFVIAVVMSLFHLWTAATGIMIAHKQRAVHLLFVLVLGFSLYPAKKNKKDAKIPIYDWVFIGLSVIINSYILIFYEDLVRRGAQPTTLDMIMGIVTIILVLEMTRRSIGPELPTIAIVFLAYALLGHVIPGRLGHIGYDLDRIVNQMYMTTEGIFGVPLGVSATFVFLFILFGAFLEVTGVGQFFIDFAFSIAGHLKGGPAKAAIIASGFMGSISGSSIANTVTTGSFTIPLMKRVGYHPNFSGAVEAAASTGGQILPPIMGAAAFIMAEFTGIAYVQIIVAALIPAMLYYLGVLTMVHLEASKQGLTGLSKSEIPDFKKVIKDGFHLIIPIVGIVILLVIRSPLAAAYYSILLAIFSSLLRKHTRIDLKKILYALEQGAKKAIGVAAACACAGIIVGVVTLSGLGTTFANLVINLAGGYLLLTLFLTMIASIILGMGLPTTAKYIILATMAVPALTGLEVHLLAAHLFVLYFGVVADVTPPVALAAYAGAGVAGGNSFKTGVNALKLGLAGFIIPYVFAVSPTILLIDTTFLQATIAIITAVLGVIGLGSAVQKYLITHTKFYDQVLFLLSALTLLVPGITSDIGGVVCFGLALGIQYMRKKQDQQVTSSESA
ncbi:C4-dicarboxylate ABC transporter permease [Natranaerobius trueperi]|uniref:C4-dicarboxylate ABC transporter permease n=2 Tax=Natranaerobius trueperi TaxID=759412 RepID=A0A226BXU4_9FIRM|nr:C4-dicarboxylate ABC transporter permease [Natranaerobius trueperi]